MARFLHLLCRIKKIRMMNRKIVTSLLSLALFCGASAQNSGVWSLNDCMEYAVANSPKVKKQAYANANATQDYRAAVASLFPSVSGQVQLASNFGRSIDPETNTYSNTSNLSNAYQVSGNLPLFNAGVLINNIKVAKVSRLLGIRKQQQIEDELAMNTMQAYANVVYYSRTVVLAQEKLAESRRNLYKTERMEQLGLKGKADVAQIAAQAATDDADLTRQQNLYASALLTLKENMNYPPSGELQVDTAGWVTPLLAPAEDVGAIYRAAVETNPVAQQAGYNLQASRLNHKIARGRLFPSLSLNGGISTNYYDILSGGGKEKSYPSFGKQFSNNRGEWVGVTLSIPLFDGLSRRANLNKARNNVRIAREEQVEIFRQLQNEIERAVQDRDGYAKEAVQMEKQVEANRTAYEVTLKKYEKGLLSALELQTSANNLTQAQANRVQAMLNYRIKSKLVAYYKGIPLIEETNK